MTTSWNETEQIEQHVHGFADAGNALVFEAQLILNPALAEKVQWQRKTYSVIQDYGRRQLKKEIEAVHDELFRQPKYRSFSQRIRRLFTNK